MTLSPVATAILGHASHIVGHCLLERDGLARYVTREVTLQLLERDSY